MRTVIGIERGARGPLGTFPNPVTDPFTIAIGTVTTNTPALTITSTMNEGSTAFHTLLLDLTDTASSVVSKPILLKVNGAELFAYNLFGELILRKPGNTTPVGLRVEGTGIIGIGAGLDPDSGTICSVIKCFFEDPAHMGGNDPASAAVISGQGGNRLSIESIGAIVSIAGNGRNEWETLHASNPVNWAIFRAGTANGRPLLLNNHAQTFYPASIFQIGADSASHVGLQVGGYDGSSFTSKAQIDAGGNGDFEGRLNAARLCTDTYTVATAPPTPQMGDKVFFTDLAAVTWGITAAGGGSGKSGSEHDGTDWKVK